MLSEDAINFLKTENITAEDVAKGLKNLAFTDVLKSNNTIEAESAPKVQSVPSVPKQTEVTLGTQIKEKGTTIFDTFLKKDNK